MVQSSFCGGNRRGDLPIEDIGTGPNQQHPDREHQDRSARHLRFNEQAVTTKTGERFFSNLLVQNRNSTAQPSIVPVHRAGVLYQSFEQIDCNISRRGGAGDSEFPFRMW